MAAAVTSLPSAAAPTAPTSVPTCEGGNAYDGSDIGIRISAIFVIWIGSLMGALLPVIARRNKGMKLMPPVVFFLAKYFGSGVIVATAFIHLLAPAADALTDPCLTGPVTEYDWAEGIALMTVFLLFFVELIIMRSGAFESHSHEHQSPNEPPNKGEEAALAGKELHGSVLQPLTSPALRTPTESSIQTPIRGEDHLGHNREHSIVAANDDHAGHHHHHHHEGDDETNPRTAEDYNIALSTHASYDDYAAQMTAIFVLEFGVVFHSIFIGLTLAVTSPAEFPVLYVVLVFHQTFEGLGLGTRLAMTPWRRDTRRARWTPFFLAIGYSLSTPLATAIGLGVRTTFEPGSQTALITNGVFDSISAGILLYTGLVELMAHEFMFSETMRRAKISVMLTAFGVMCLGAGLMALLGKWA